MPSMTYTNGVNSITVTTPEYGYTVDIVMAFDVVKHTSGYSSYDHGSGNDYRILKARHILTAAQMSDWNTFFRGTDKGRCETLTISLGATATGFYPAGPDHGSVGNFTGRMIRQQQSSIMLQPYKYFSVDFEMLILSTPSYSLPTEVSQGTLQIGTVQYLMWPQDSTNPEQDYSHVDTVSIGGDASFVDLGSTADVYTAQWMQRGNQSKMAALVNYITATGRTGDITIVPPTGAYLFGMQNGASSTYTATLTKNEIVVTHDNVDNFTAELSWHCKAVA